MSSLSSLFPAILAVHVALAISLFVPSLLLPFTLRNRSVERGVTVGPPGRLVRLLQLLQARGTVAIGTGLAMTGIAMLAVLGPRLLEHMARGQPRDVRRHGDRGLAVQRPGLRRLQAREGIASDAIASAGGLGPGSATSPTPSRRRWVHRLPHVAKPVLW